MTRLNFNFFFIYYTYGTRFVFCFIPYTGFELRSITLLNQLKFIALSSGHYRFQFVHLIISLPLLFLRLFYPSCLLSGILTEKKPSDNVNASRPIPQPTSRICVLTGKYAIINCITPIFHQQLKVLSCVPTTPAKPHIARPPLLRNIRA